MQPPPAPPSIDGQSRDEQHFFVWPGSQCAARAQNVVAETQHEFVGPSQTAAPHTRFPDWSQYTVDAPASEPPSFVVEPQYPGASDVRRHESPPQSALVQHLLLDAVHVSPQIDPAAVSQQLVVHATSVPSAPLAQ